MRRMVRTWERFGTDGEGSRNGLVKIAAVVDRETEASALVEHIVKWTPLERSDASPNRQVWEETLVLCCERKR